MQRFKYGLLTLCFLSSMLLGVIAEAVTVQEVIKKARAHLGKEEVLSNVESMIFSAHMVDADGKRIENIELSVQKPMSMRILRRSASQVTITATNGYEGFKLIRRGAGKEDKLYVLTHESVRRLMARAVENLYFFNGYAKMKGGKAEYEGTDTIDGRPVHKVRFTYPKGADQYLRYFDVDTGAILSAVTNDNVRQVEKETMVVNGIRFPKQVDLYSIKTDEFIGSFIYTRILINKRLSDKIFDFPAEVSKVKGWEKVEKIDE